MDQELQTSFIPKKTFAPTTPRKARGSFGLFNVLAFTVLIISLLIAGGVYLYRDNLSVRVAEMKTSLNRARTIFEPGLIEELELLDRRIEAASTILGNHIAVSPIFEVLQDLTLPTVRYIDFSYEIDPVNSSIVHVAMTGEAVSYDAITLQADLFSQNRFIRNPIFSNFSLNKLGRVEFDLIFDVSKTLVDFGQFVERGGVTQ